MPKTYMGSDEPQTITCSYVSGETFVSITRKIISKEQRDMKRISKQMKRRAWVNGTRRHH